MRIVALVALLLAGCVTAAPVPMDPARQAAHERCRRITFPPEAMVGAVLFGGGMGMAAAYDLCMAQAGYERGEDPAYKQAVADQQREHCRSVSGGREEAYQACMTR